MPGRITRESIERLTRQIHLPDFLSGYMEVKRSGVHHIARCPFHSEKTPSFYIYSDHYYCYGCREHGNAIDFEMKKSGKTFVEAVEGLAERFRVQLEYVEGTESRDDAAIEQRRRLLYIQEEVAKHYHALLLSKEGMRARAYLQKRGFGLKEIQEWKLGLAIGGSTVAQLAKTKGWDFSALRTLDLVRSGDDGRIYDFFRDRIMIPIRDERGQTIAFGGRLYLTEDKARKYLNSSTNELFSKSHVLFNLDRARSHIVQKKEAIVVEGYMDCMALSNAGFQNVVAVLGTALTEDHVRKLERNTTNVTLCFDSDDAGQQATLRSYMVAFPLNLVTLNTVSVPDGKDPDEFIKRFGAEAFRKVLANPVSLTVRAAAILTEKLTSREAKIRALKDELVPAVLANPDPAQREIALDSLASQFGLSSGRSLAASVEPAKRKGEKPGAPHTNGPAVAPTPQSVAPQAKPGAPKIIPNAPVAAPVAKGETKPAAPAISWPVRSADELRFVLCLFFAVKEDLPERLASVIYDLPVSDELDKKGVERLLVSDVISEESKLLLDDLFALLKALPGHRVWQTARREELWAQLPQPMKLIVALANHDDEALSQLGYLEHVKLRQGASGRHSGMQHFGNALAPANLSYLRFLLKDLEVSASNGKLGVKLSSLLLKLEIALLDQDLARVSELLKAEDVADVEAYEQRRRKILAERTRRWAKFHR